MWFINSLSEHSLTPLALYSFKHATLPHYSNPSFIYSFYYSFKLFYDFVVLIFQFLIKSRLYVTKVYISNRSILKPVCFYYQVINLFIPLPFYCFLFRLHPIISDFSVLFVLINFP